jgi:hypothetical protein
MVSMRWVGLAVSIVAGLDVMRRAILDLIFDRRALLSWWIVTDFALGGAGLGVFNADAAWEAAALAIVWGVGGAVLGLWIIIREWLWQGMPGPDEKEE